MVPKADDTYDRPGSQESAPQASPLRDMGGGGKGDGIPAARGQPRDASAADSPEQIKDKESNPASGATSALGKEGMINKGLNTADKLPAPPQVKAAMAAVNLVKRLFDTKKKKAGGGIAALLATVLIFAFTIGQGPLQLVHLSQLLQKNFFGTEKSTNLRMKGLFRFHRTGDIGETRVTKLGSEVFKKTVAKLEKIGFDFSDRNQFTGHLKSVTIDPNKHPAFKGLDAGDRRAAIIKHFDIKDSGILSGSGSAFKIELDGTSVRGMNFANSLTDTAVGDLQSGKIVTGMGMRSMKKFYNLPRLFSPLEKRLKAVENKIATKAERKKAEADRNKALTESSNAKGADARNRLKGTLSGGAANAVAGAFITSEALCLVREVADDVVLVNRFNIVIPSVLQAVDKTAVGAQVQSGELRATSAGQVSESFIDENGKTIFGGKALQALSGKSNLSGEEISDDYKQAFSNETTAKKIKDGVGSPNIGPIDLGGAVCSPAGQIAQGAISVGLLLAGPITLGGSWAVFAGKAGAGAAATAGVTYLLKKLAVGLLKSDAIVPNVFAGPLGGNLLAYGAREAGNIGARASGGIAMAGTASLTLDKEQEEESRREFQSKSFAARMFDVYDHRSLAGNFIDNTPASPGQNITNAASSLTNIGSLFSSLFSAFTPRAYAASTPYDWAFPRYGIDTELIQSEYFQDPYQNAIRAAELLNGPDSGDYIDRARKCFGADINKDSGVWDAVSVEEVNPNGPDYAGANCDDTSGEWKRIYVFVFDTRLITTVACWEGDEEACDDVGAGSGQAQAAAPATPGGTGGASIAAVAEQEYAKNGNKALETCGENCGPEVQKYTGGPSGADAPWCAWFVSWIYREAGYEFKGAPAGADGNIPAVVNLVAWFKQHGIHFTPSSTQYKPEPGDVVMYGGDTHTGIVVKVNGDNIETVEGNTSGDGSFNANGETVGRKKYNYKTYTSRSIEFGRLKNP